MSNANPYAPPRAAVADVDPDDKEVQPVRTWSAKGRIGRLRYLAHVLAGYLIVLIPALIVGGVMAQSMPMLGNLVVLAGSVAYLLFFAFKTIQRSHDMNWTGWTAILAIVPLVNLVWIFRSGTKGSNRFGAVPPPNTLGVKILAFGILGAAAVAGMVAGMALPSLRG